MDNHDIENSTKELTLADIEDLRNALGAEAEVNPTEVNAAAPGDTTMCIHWF